MSFVAPSSEPAAHRFKVKTWSTPQFCDICNKLLWGLVRQGVCCQKCNTCAHFNCSETALPCPGAKMKRSERRSLSRSAHASSSALYAEHPDHQQAHVDDDDEEDDGTSTMDRPFLAAAAAGTDLPAHGARIPTEDAVNRALTSTLPADTLATIAKVQQRQNATGKDLARVKATEGVGASADSDAGSSKKGWRGMMDEIIVSTSRHAARMELKPREPGLNLVTTTPKNMTRFALRTGGVHGFEIAVKDILAWQNKTLTLLVLCVFTLLCLYPIALVIAPQFLIVYYMGVGYYENTKKKARLEAAGKKIRPPKIDLDTTPSISPSQLKENLQFVQNSMSMFCDGYDTVVLFQRQYLNWDQPENAMSFLKIVAASTIPAVALVHYVPLNHLVMGLGWLVFVSNTPLAIAIQETLTPVLLEILNENWEFAKGVARRWPEVMKIKPRRSRRAGAAGADTKDADGEDGKQSEEGQYMVAIYQNERWWLGLGFINYLLTSERPAWSDYTGTIPLPPKSSYTPPPGFQFLDADWHIDTTWSVVSPDESGWVYSDHLWGSQRGAAGVGSLTRRRKWVRRVVRRTDATDSAAAARVLAAVSARSSIAVDGASVISDRTATTTAAAAPGAAASVLPSPPMSSTPSSTTTTTSTTTAAAAAAAVPMPPSPVAEPLPIANTSPDSGTVSDGTAVKRQSSAAASVVSVAETLFRPEPSLAAALPKPAVAAAAPTAPLAVEGTEEEMIVSEEEDDGEEIEYILTIDGEEIVLEGVKSLDRVDMDRLRELVRSIKRNSRSSGSVRRVRLE